MNFKRKVLFLCTGNCCRSQMAEAILSRLGSERFEALSAGSHPAGFVYPLAIEALQRLDMPIDECQTSKSWDEFADAPVDAVITLCDVAAGESCPTWPGSPIKAHWSLPDPGAIFGTDEERTEFTLRVAKRLRTKIEGLVELDWSLPAGELTKRLQFLGEI